MSDDVQRISHTSSALAHFDARAAVAFCAAAVAFAVTAFAPQVLNDGDTFFHIAAGSRMLADHAILYRDPFSYTFAGAPWQAHEWLAEIAMSLSFRAGGWSGLIFLFAIASATTAGLLAYHLGRWLDWPAQAVVTLLALACMTPSLLARPHLLALPLLELWTAGLVIARSERRAPSYALLPVMALWVNIHGTFLLGLALLGALALEAVSSEENRVAAFRDWGFFAAGAFAAALLNPHFLSGILFPISLMGAAGLANVSEWRPTDFSQLQPFTFVLLAALYFAVTRGVKIQPLRALSVLVLLFMALQHQRHQIVFALAAPLLVVEQMSPAEPNFRSSERSAQIAGIFASLAILAVIVLAWLRIFIPASRVDSPVAPIAALQHVPPELRAEHVLNDYSFGGYLIFEGVRPFVDSRVELYGDQLLARYARIIEADPSEVRATLRAYDIRWTILGRHSPTVQVMDTLPGWHRFYSDDFAVVHIRDKYAR
jgi:hypothetical protein